MYFQGSGSGRPGLHICSGLRQQPNPNLPPRRHIPEGVRMLGVGRRGVQGYGGHRSHVQRQHTGVRPREPQGTSVLGANASLRYQCSFTLLISASMKCIISFQGAPENDLFYKDMILIHNAWNLCIRRVMIRLSFFLTLKFDFSTLINQQLSSYLTSSVESQSFRLEDLYKLTRLSSQMSKILSRFQQRNGIQNDFKTSSRNIFIVSISLYELL